MLDIVLLAFVFVVQFLRRHFVQIVQVPEVTQHPNVNKKKESYFLLQLIFMVVAVLVVSVVDFIVLL